MDFTLPVQKKRSWKGTYLVRESCDCGHWEPWLLSQAYPETNKGSLHLCVTGGSNWSHMFWVQVTMYVQDHSQPIWGAGVLIGFIMGFWDIRCSCTTGNVLCLVSACLSFFPIIDSNLLIAYLSDRQTGLEPGSSGRGALGAFNLWAILSAASACLSSRAKVQMEPSSMTLLSWKSIAAF